MAIVLLSVSLVVFVYTYIAKNRLSEVLLKLLSCFVKMAREYDHLFKLLIIGDSGEYAIEQFSLEKAMRSWYKTCLICAGVGKSSLLLRFADNTFSGK